MGNVELKASMLNEDICKYGKILFEYDELAQAQINVVHFMVADQKEVKDILDCVESGYDDKVKEIIAFLSQYGIYDYSMDYFKQTNPGYSDIYQECADYYQHVLDITNRQNANASSQLSSAASAANGSIHGLKYGMIGDPIQLWIYDSFNESEIKRTTEKAQQYYNQRQREIMNLRDYNIRSESQQYYHSTFERNMCEAVSRLYTVLFSKHIQLLCDVGEIKENNISSLDEKHCYEIMKNLPLVVDKIDLLKRAVQLYPFNTSIYIEAIKNDIFDSEFADVVRYIDTNKHIENSILEYWNVKEIINNKVEQSEGLLKQPLEAIAKVQQVGFIDVYGPLVRDEAIKRKEKARIIGQNIDISSPGEVSSKDLNKQKQAYKDAIIAFEAIPEGYADKEEKASEISACKIKIDEITKDERYVCAVKDVENASSSSLKRLDYAITTLSDLSMWRDAKKWISIAEEKKQQINEEEKNSAKKLKRIRWLLLVFAGVAIIAIVLITQKVKRDEQNKFDNQELFKVLERSQRPTRPIVISNKYYWIKYEEEGHIHIHSSLDNRYENRNEDYKAVGEILKRKYGPFSGGWLRYGDNSSQCNVYQWDLDDGNIIQLVYDYVPLDHDIRSVTIYNYQEIEANDDWGTPIDEFTFYR